MATEAKEALSAFFFFLLLCPSAGLSVFLEKPQQHLFASSYPFVGPFAGCSLAALPVRRVIRRRG